MQSFWLSMPKVTSNRSLFSNPFENPPAPQNKSATLYFFAKNKSSLIHLGFYIECFSILFFWNLYINTLDFCPSFYVRLLFVLKYAVMKKDFFPIQHRR